MQELLFDVPSGSCQKKRKKNTTKGETNEFSVMLMSPLSLKWQNLDMHEA